MSDRESLAWAVFEADGTCVCVCSEQQHAQTAIEELAYDGMVCESLHRSPRWIPVSERLPEDRVRVLTCGDDPVEGPFMLIGYREPASKFGPADWHLPCFAVGPVTHWMPLPEPPAQ